MATINQTLGTDLASLAQLLRSKGRGKDTILAHITPKEAALLKKRGGRGSKNPITGLLEFDDGVDTTPVAEAPAPSDAPQVEQSAPGQNVMPVGVSPENQNAIENYNYDVLPGETGNIGTLNGNVVYPSSTVTTPTIQSTPTPAELQALQVGGPEDTAAQQTAQQPGQTTTKPKGLDLGSLGTIGGNDLLRLGLAGALGAFGASQARKTAAQGAAVQGQQQAIAQPYQQQGQQLIAQAQSGTLSPTSQQAYNAAKAQLAQSQSNRGGVGAQQAANQLSDVYQRLLNAQYTYGLNVMQIGDNISLGAIKTGLQLDQQLNTATTNFYTQLAQMVAGGGGQSVTVRAA